ncbi:Holliday junction resolvase RuvX [Candidatus Parcubacteria bacterium]|nr:MAG: Holliday junction resolvase RuvX [Candidatus Parcubacteria bacterium]
MEEKIYLGIDWGEARIGLAMGDSILKIATPYGVVEKISQIVDVVKDEDISEIVLGDPRKLKDEDKSFHESYLSFKKKLEEISGVNVVSVDERMSSKAADALEGDKKTKSARDAIAAMIILQGYLDTL